VPWDAQKCTYQKEEGGKEMEVGGFGSTHGVIDPRCRPKKTGVRPVKIVSPFLTDLQAEVD
jgi:hypothetical protein